MHNSLSSDTLPARHQPLPPRPAPARTTPTPTPEHKPEEATDPTKGSRRTAGTPKPDTLDAELAQLEGTRLSQLDAIDENVRDAITAAYRDSVLRALENIRTARERLAAGTYGLCTWCSKAIPPERLELIPSAPMCVPCTVHTRAG
jgi:RNA polymerase-binding transcription factor DksA